LQTCCCGATVVVVREVVEIGVVDLQRLVGWRGALGQLAATCRIED